MQTLKGAFRQKALQRCLLGHVGCDGARLSSSAAVAAAQASSTAVSGKAPLMKDFLVYRWDPEKPHKPAYKTYKVDLNR